MKVLSGLTIAVVFTFVIVTPLMSQQAIVRKTANIRPDPSVNEAPEGQVKPGDALTLLDPTPEHGYYQ